MATMESLAADVAYLKDALHELLRRVPGVVAITMPAEEKPGVEYWPSAIEGQRIPRITGDPSTDFTAAMIGMHNVKPSPVRDANLAAWQAEHDNKVYAGKYHAGSIDDAAAGFVYAYSMSQPGSALANRLYYTGGLFAGPLAAINDLMGRGEAWRHGKGLADPDIVAAYPDSEFKRDVLAVRV